MQYHTTIFADNPFTSGGDLKLAVFSTLNAHTEAIALMLQGYHSREKVRHVRFEEESLAASGPETFTVMALYSVEEFSVCSNTDTLDTEKMKLTLYLSAPETGIKVEGVYIPEREPDSL